MLSRTEFLLYETNVFEGWHIFWIEKRKRVTRIFCSEKLCKLWPNWIRNPCTRSQWAPLPTLQNPCIMNYQLSMKSLCAFLSGSLPTDYANVCFGLHFSSADDIDWYYPQTNNFLLALQVTHDSKLLKRSLINILILPPQHHLVWEVKQGKY